MQASKHRDFIKYCNIVLIGCHYSPTAETPTRGDVLATVIITAVVIAVVVVLVIIVMTGVMVAILMEACVHGAGPREHVREMYPYELCAVFVL